MIQGFSETAGIVLRALITAAISVYLIGRVNRGIIAACITKKLYKNFAKLL